MNSMKPTHTVLMIGMSDLATKGKYDADGE